MVGSVPDYGFNTYWFKRVSCKPANLFDSLGLHLYGHGDRRSCQAVCCPWGCEEIQRQWNDCPHEVSYPLIYLLPLILSSGLLSLSCWTCRNTVWNYIPSVVLCFREDYFNKKSEERKQGRAEAKAKAKTWVCLSLHFENALFWHSLIFLKLIIFVPMFLCSSVKKKRSRNKQKRRRWWVLWCDAMCCDVRVCQTAQGTFGWCPIHWQSIVLGEVQT